MSDGEWLDGPDAAAYSLRRVRILLAMNRLLIADPTPLTISEIAEYLQRGTHGVASDVDFLFRRGFIQRGVHGGQSRGWTLSPEVEVGP